MFTSFYSKLTSLCMLNTKAHGQVPTTLKPCNPKIPDAATCVMDPLSCSKPEKIPYCQRYCGLCSETVTSPRLTTVVTVEECVDDSPLCPLRKNECESETHVQKVCKKSCGLCTEPTTAKPTTVEPIITKPTTVEPTTIGNHIENMALLFKPGNNTILSKLLRLVLRKSNISQTPNLKSQISNSTWSSTNYFETL